MHGSRSWKAALLAIVLLAVVVGSVGAAPRYTITAIGPLAGDQWSTAPNINESGQVAGVSYNAGYGGLQWPPLPDAATAFTWVKVS
ncbi:MAG: hypothetical protein IT210_26030 [Armatimonadetes bacterium]|nr:hypothetical protein [Armatimonadota bacterium]